MRLSTCQYSAACQFQTAHIPLVAISTSVGLMLKLEVPAETSVKADAATMAMLVGYMVME